MSDSLSIAFRVDASTLIGSGHVMRCLTLADALAEAGARCYFVMREKPGSLEAVVSARGHQVLVLSPVEPDVNASPSDNESPHASWLGTGWITDASGTLAALAGMDLDWLVVDHYALDYRWESLVSGCAKRLMVIDDLADREHDCDLLLDQTYGRLPASYRKLVPPEARLLCGAHFSLLRPEFSELRYSSLQRRIRPKLQNMLISIGGVDQDNLTHRALRVLDSLEWYQEKNVTVVMGPSSPWVEDIGRLAGSIKLKVEVLVGIGNMAEVMEQQDFVIGAAGSSIWERCCLGLPSAMVVVAENQVFAARELEGTGAVRILESGERFEDSLIGVLKDIDSCPGQLIAMSKAAAATTDGQGVFRVVATLLELGGDHELRE
ncbi:UDP-2,4-diacetamido-2,4,6-trideoxy-beta-L-altropyranose hydrolase [Marinobacter subterrani]|uniref:Pseudaminic acid biosynthesis-associated protein PseG n=1 Tax=Marinobacter subterrani TaxID=1658765 RepID=A0A0J7JAX4_9GAMM|nr:UDP-2,4-diacetamido-2,4,6-trideoxy-beta-L-altropyranose hydrolase [Marinobacter subterrani]KMQ75021.1 pseudaminic acid biosynthesis-associated protein PseG [Marinobacter subterrani]